MSNYAGCRPADRFHHVGRPGDPYMVFNDPQPNCTCTLAAKPSPHVFAGRVSSEDYIALGEAFGYEFAKRATYHANGMDVWAAEYNPQNGTFWSPETVMPDGTRVRHNITQPDGPRSVVNIEMIVGVTPPVALDCIDVSVVVDDRS